MTTLFWISYVALWTLAVALFVAVFVLFRHHGEMLLNSRPARSHQGPGDGSKFPRHSLMDVRQEAWQTPAEGQAQLVVLSIRDCKLCERTLEALSEFADERGGAIATAFVHHGSQLKLNEMVRRQPVLSRHLRLISDPRGTIQRAVRVTRTPYAFMIDADGTIVRSSLASEKRHLDWLAEALPQGSQTQPDVRATA